VKHPPVWNRGFLAVLIVLIVTFAAAQETGSRKFAPTRRVVGCNRRVSAQASGGATSGAPNGNTHRM
jgi:hypothetical protein